MTCSHVVGLLVGGTAATLLCKSILSTKVVLYGVQYAFAKPAFCAFLVFCGYTLTLPIGAKRGAGLGTVTLGHFLGCLALSTLDVCSITLLQSGLVLIPASSSLMLRMSAIGFAAFFRRIIFGQRLAWRQVFALCVLVLALTTVAWSLTMGMARRGALLGCGLTVLAQVFRGLILVGEEHFMRTLSPFGVLVLEGCISIAIMLVITFPVLCLLPGPDHGALEWFPGTLDMVGHSSALAFLICSYVASLVWESSSGIMVTALFSSVHRSFLQFGVRIMMVWLCDLALFWCSGGRYGEPWTPASNVQLCGFGMLLASASLYFNAQVGAGEGAFNAKAASAESSEPLLH